MIKDYIYVLVCVLAKNANFCGYRRHSLPWHHTALRFSLRFYNIFSDCTNSTRFQKCIHRHFYDYFSNDDPVQPVWHFWTYQEEK